MKQRVLSKVTAFVTRGSGRSAELLLFRHPTAGVQVPAGTVEIGEDIGAAVLREVCEETGLTAVRIERQLETLLRTLPDNERAVIRATKLFDEPAADASAAGFMLTRGMTVLIGETVSGFVRTIYEEHDLNQEPWQLLIRAEGWVRTSVLGSRIERHLFHLTALEETPAAWEQAADGHLFQLFWSPLVPQPRLVIGQNEWLDAVYPALFAAA